MYAKLVTLKAGYKYDKEDINKHLTLNSYYLIDHIYQESSHTTIFLKDFGRFNSVFFELYDNDKKLIEDLNYSEELQKLTVRDY